MHTITRNLREGKRTFSIFTKQEADSQNLQYVGWRKVRPGEWALTDDQFVAECLKRKTYHRRGRPVDFVMLSFAARWDTPSTRFTFQDHYDTGVFGYVTSPRSWIEREAGKTRTKVMVREYVRMVLARDVDYTKLGLIYRKDQRIPAASVRRILKQETIKQMVSQEMEAKLKEAGIDVNYVFDLYKKAVMVAEEEGDAASIVKVAQDLAEILDVKPKKATITRVLTGQVTKEIEGDIERESKLLEAREELPVNPLEVREAKFSDIPEPTPDPERNPESESAPTV